MKRSLTPLAAGLAALMGAMAVFAGGSVLFLSRDPGYAVIGWLPAYNFAMGLVALLVASVLIWRRHRFALPLAIVTLVLHAAVLGVLLIAMRDAVATASVVAMVIRVITWAAIAALIWVAGDGGRRG